MVLIELNEFEEKCITNYGNNICFVCDRPYQHYIIKDKLTNGITQVRYKVCHRKCELLIERLRRHKERVLDTEWKLFCLSNQKYFHEKIE